MDDVSFLDECTAGNFVLYDWTQVQIGSCTPDDVALYVNIPVAQIKKENRTGILHGGAVHLSKDFVDEEAGRNCGQMVIYRKETEITLLDGDIGSISHINVDIRALPAGSV